MFVLPTTQAESIRVTIENAQPADGFFFTPVWVGFHSGEFDLHDIGQQASSGLETIAETGDANALSGEFTGIMNSDGTSRFDAIVTSPGGFEGAPVFDPGDSVTVTLDVTDPASNRYLTFASMVIPSNDAFIGNGDPLAHRIFNADGTFAGPVTIDVLSEGIYDSGTELNNGMGAAFSAIGGTETDEGGTVSLHAGLDNFLGTGTAAGTTVNSPLANGEVLARIHVTAVPEPGAFGLMGIAAIAIASLRRRRLPAIPSSSKNRSTNG